jgi:hypothetical protein
MKGKAVKFLVLHLVFCVTSIAYAQEMRKIDVGKLQARVFDDGIQSATNLPMSHCIYPRGSWIDPWDYINTNTYWPGGLLRQAATLVGSRNWTDTLSNFWPYHVTGHCAHSSTSPDNPYQFTIPDGEGYTIHRYLRYPLPEIYVNGFLVSDSFPLEGDVVDPDKVWGTADMMVECHYRLSNGMDVYQRNLAWSQKDHDDYVVWDLTFVNTGNTDSDTLIELPGQTLDSVVIMKHYEALPNAGLYPFGSWAGVTEDHNTRLTYPQDDDSLRINYVALARKYGHDHDSYGDRCERDWGGEVDLEDGCRWMGHAILFAPKNTSVPQSYPIADVAASNDPAQPSMHSTIEDGYGIYDVEDLQDTADHRETYRIMRMGIHGYDDILISECENVYDMSIMYDVYDTTATGAQTYYDQPQDRMGEWQLSRGEIFPRDWDYYEFCTAPKFSIGPYSMEYGDTIRFVYAVVAGSVHRKTTYILSRMRANDSARYYGWVAGMDSADIREEYEKRDPPAELYGDVVYMGGGLNEIATDYVISTGKDSLFSNGLSAQRNFNLNYNIPPSPPPPSIFEIDSGTNAIRLRWHYEEPPVDLAGFKIYRATGSAEYNLIDGDSVVGDWVLLDSISPLDSSYVDSFVPGDVDFYYAITAVGNNGIESGIYLTMMPEGSPVWAGIDDKEYSFNGMEVSSVVFSNSLVVKYTLEKRLPVTLSMYNLAGQCVQRFLSGENQEAGEYNLELKPKSLPSGIYFLNIKAGGLSDCKKCVLLE